MMPSHFLITMAMVGMCTAARGGDRRGGFFDARPSSLSACVDQIENPPVEEGPNPFSEMHACLEDCLATTSRSQCVGVMNPAEVKDLYNRIGQAVKDCAVASGQCTEDPSFGRRGRDKRHGGRGHMRELLEELEARDPAAAAELNSCHESCRPSREGRRGREKRQGHRGHHGRHHGKGGGMCLKAFCPCETLRSCKDEAKIDYQTDLEILQFVKQQACTCFLTGSANGDIDPFCIEEDDESSEERPCPE